MKKQILFIFSLLIFLSQAAHAQDVLSLKPGALDAYRGKVASMVLLRPKTA